MSSSRKYVHLRSDYIGAGNYVALPENRGVAVNTTYGVQAVAIDGKVLWQVDLGERALGVAWNDDGELLATTLHAAHRITADGRVLMTQKTRHEISHAPVPLRTGTLIATLTRLYSMDIDGKVIWKYRLREALGESVRAVVVLGVYERDEGIVVGAVDYNSGVGRLLVFSHAGSLLWQSELGPLTSLFPVGGDAIFYTLTGYGRFESALSDLEGNVRWRLSHGGPGTEISGQRIALLVGTNESPTWDDWELRTYDEFGEQLDARTAHGRACHPPVVGPDGALYFSTFLNRIDPAESRIDYTSFIPQPAFQAFDYLLRVKATSHQHDVFYYRADDDSELELLFQDGDSVGFGPTVAGESHVFFVHNKDILAFEIS